MKKFISGAIIVILTMLVTANAFAVETVSADDALSVLSQLKIFEGGDGDLRPSGAITRAEFAAVVCRMKGYGEAAEENRAGHIFTDVPSGHWASGYIAMAFQAGIVAGNGDGTFEPDENVTYEQVIKMIVCAVGYEPKAASLGGYPTGHLMVANQEGITAGTTSTTNSFGETPRSTVAKLAYQAITIPIMDQITWGPNAEYKKMENISLLYSGLGIIKATAKITELSDGGKAKVEYSSIDKVAENNGWYINEFDTSLPVVPNLLSDEISVGDFDLTDLKDEYFTAFLSIANVEIPVLSAYYAEQ
jgi:hypothetical protein